MVCRLCMLQLLVVLVSYPVRLLASSKSASKKQSSEQNRAQNMAELFPPHKEKRGKAVWHARARDISNPPRTRLGSQ